MLLFLDLDKNPPVHHPGWWHETAPDPAKCRGIVEFCGFSMKVLLIPGRMIVLAVWEKSPTKFVGEGLADAAKVEDGLWEDGEVKKS